MANARALDKRRKSIRNIKKITRTMELIATARFKKAMDRATSASDYTKRITSVVADLARAGLEVSHPLLEAPEETKSATLLVLTGNRGLCGGYNGNAIRLGAKTYEALSSEIGNVSLEVSGKRGISGFNFRDMAVAESFTNFDDQPLYAEVEMIANRYLRAYAEGTLDRLDVTYTKFISVAKQEIINETLLPLGKIEGAEVVDDDSDASGKTSLYEFVPSAESILEEVVPTSFKIKLFKCFLDAAVSEQVARMVAMKSATENANDMIKMLSRTYNRARQSQITGEIMEVIGGVEALEG
ncbi:MAG: ATP synthase F1 subunit gamma [Mariniblastus sp.]|mgnify:FL=1|nr:ATP synthase F1 subunit gamma [Mariniblastus sp.]MDG1512736.1 ATP synthase F1 subunit gamma [Mariniblastus sp.]MDG2183319.1 ATP synthase F1 subunit gamma [Mariniblastus sp.]